MLSSLRLHGLRVDPAASNSTAWRLACLTGLVALPVAAYVRDVFGRVARVAKAWEFFYLEPPGFLCDPRVNLVEHLGRPPTELLCKIFPRHCQRVSQSVAPSPLSGALPRQVHARRSNLLTRRRLLPPARIVSRVPQPGWQRRGRACRALQPCTRDRPLRSQSGPLRRRWDILP